MSNGGQIGLRARVTAFFGYLTTVNFWVTVALGMSIGQMIRIIELENRYQDNNLDIWKRFLAVSELLDRSVANQGKMIERFDEYNEIFLNLNSLPEDEISQIANAHLRETVELLKVEVRNILEKNAQNDENILSREDIEDLRGIKYKIENLEDSIDDVESDYQFTSMLQLGFITLIVTVVLGGIALVFNNNRSKSSNDAQSKD